MAKKRANGEGSIRKKPNGRWEGRYTQGIDPNTGRAIQKSVSARTQAECKEKLAKAIRDNRGVPVNHNEDYTVAQGLRSTPIRTSPTICREARQRRSAASWKRPQPSRSRNRLTRRRRAGAR